MRDYYTLKVSRCLDVETKSSFFEIGAWQLSEEFGLRTQVKTNEYMFPFLLLLLSNFMTEKKKRLLPQWKIPHFSIKMHHPLPGQLQEVFPRRQSQGLGKG